MTQEELQQLTEEISIRFFNKPFIHKATFNKRLRTTGGRYLLRTHHIEMNPHLYEAFGMDELIGVIKHELCHYHLHLEKKGYKHSDYDFKYLLNKVGGSRYCQSVLEKRRIESYKYQYNCTDCMQSYKRKRRIDTKKYVCGKCKGKLKLISLK
ncbi:SprT family protein [Fictibacillus nanhaiensis]|uniref:SprT family protein n=1 Tax=Fictibacillus nanhaiensis TaxID=742169 RepID=UPI001C93FEBE|nr:SprT family protein [Fictibacillus nanhaiensis]MBY6038258.1 SprT family protein [Fictibacillus nanhaiensis]